MIVIIGLVILVAAVVGVIADSLGAGARPQPPSAAGVTPPAANGSKPVSAAANGRAEPG